jgi:hypothetical protein
VLLLSFVLLSWAPGATQGPDLPAIVAEFYSQSLDAELVQIDATESTVRNQCYAVLASDQRGDATLVVAAYANTYAGQRRWEGRALT